MFLLLILLFIVLVGVGRVRDSSEVVGDRSVRRFRRRVDPHRRLQRVVVEKGRRA